MQNVYQIRNSNCSSSSVRLTVNGKSQSIAFINRRRNGLLIYETSNEEIQTAIEGLSGFKSGAITRIVGESPIVEEVPVKATVAGKKAKSKVASPEDEELSGDKLPVVGDASGDGGDEEQETPRPLGTPHEGNLADELPVVPGAATSFLEVTGWQAAKEILRNAPYNVAFQSLGNTANILKKALECGVVFPNLPVE